jgi:hypothetical protein
MMTGEFAREPLRPIWSGITLLLLVALVATSSAAVPDARADSLCPEPAAADAFFPQGALDGQSARLDAFTQQSYSKHLRAMGEPSLSCGLRHEDEVYRFLWLRTFHHPIAVRITHAGGGAMLVVTELTGAGGYEPGVIGMREERPLSGAEWNALTKALAGIDFWNMPTKPPRSLDAIGMDGAQWILEGYRAGTYHVIDRWSPKSVTYRDVCLKFLALARHTVSDVY